MVFKRRNIPSLMQRIREAVYPRKGWLRPWEYIGHRLKRLPDPPHKIALGIAVGAFISFTPLFGFHFAAAAMLAWSLRANIPASILGTFFGNPITFPFIVTISLTLGRKILGMGVHHGEYAAIQDAFLGAFTGLWQSTKSMFGYGPSAWDRLGEFWSDLFLPYLVGGIIPGIVVGIACYFLSRPLIAAYQMRRRHRLIARAKERLALKKTAMHPDAAQ